VRLLFTSFPGYGHASPMVPLARAAWRAGHDVLFSTGPDLCPWIESLGFATAPSGLSAQETAARYRARSPHSDSLPSEERMRLVLPKMFVDIAARARAADLHPLVQEWKPDLIVHEVTDRPVPPCGSRRRGGGASQ
jgi:UDP:flavonoid glycosyltransferase YjiC (YdhE family)